MYFFILSLLFFHPGLGPALAKLRRNGLYFTSKAGDVLINSAIQLSTKLQSRQLSR